MENLKKMLDLNLRNIQIHWGYKFYGIIAPNIFGPFCKPDYNSFIATFSSMIIENK